MMLHTLNRCDRPTALLRVAALSLALSAGGVSAAGPQAAYPALAAHEAAGGTSLARGASAERDPIRVRIEGFSERTAKLFYLGCSSAAMAGRLGGGDAQACSIGYDVLLKRHFDGDFLALLAWSRSQSRPSDAEVALDDD